MTITYGQISQDKSYDGTKLLKTHWHALIISVLSYINSSLHRKRKSQFFTKLNHVRNEVSYAYIPSTYYPQIYKLINGLDVTKNDLVLL